MSFTSSFNTKCCTTTTKDLDKYIRSAVESRILDEAKYWTMRPIELTTSSFLTNAGPNYFYKYLTVPEITNGFIRVEGINNPAILFPPTAVDLFAQLNTTIRIGDTFRFTVANASTTNSVFLFTSNINGAFSVNNSTYNGWLHRMILPQQTVTYWIRITSPTSYEFVRSHVEYRNVAAIPSAATAFPDDGSFVAIVTDVLANRTPPTGGTFDVPNPDPLTGVA